MEFGKAPEKPLPAILYNKTSETIENYKIKINAGGPLDIRESGEVTITFVNGIFKRAVFPFSGIYTRNGWRILAAIEREISKIEEDYENKI